MIPSWSQREHRQRRIIGPDASSAANWADTRRRWSLYCGMLPMAATVD